MEAYADRYCGLEADERLFTRNRNQERNIAAMFMVDMSGSTDASINGLEREALIEAWHLGIHPYCITIDDEALAAHVWRGELHRRGPHQQAPIQGLGDLPPPYPVNPHQDFAPRPVWWMLT
jgi:hypothetical protein